MSAQGAAERAHPPEGNIAAIGAVVDRSTRQPVMPPTPEASDSSTVPRRRSRVPTEPVPVGPGRSGAGPIGVTADRDSDHEIRLVRALSEAAGEMHRSLSMADVLKVATDSARSIIGVRQAVTSQTTNQDWANAVEVVSVDRGEPMADLVPPPGSELYDRVCASNRPVRLQARDLDGRWPGIPNAPTPVRSWLAAPLVDSGGRNLGLVQLADRLDGADFTVGDEAVLVQLARMASVAIENARLYEAALDTRSQLAWSAHIERVRAAELRAVIEAMSEAVLVCDGSGKVSLTNPAADALFGAGTVATYDDLFDRFDLPDRGLAALDPPLGPVEVRLRNRRDRWLELQVHPVAEVAGRTGTRTAGGRIAVMRDVTRAREAKVQRDAFLGILSHELRTPITTIYAGSMVLARVDPAATEIRQDLATDISAEAERLFRLVEDLLVMTRVERGALHLASEPVLVQRVMAQAIKLESHLWPGARFVLHGTKNPPAVAADPTYVEQVARNLLSNAAKYSPTGATIEVQLTADADEATVRVLDRGRGFATTETDDLFEIFYRSPATAAQASGAGIGLFVCRRLITAMHGRIWARPRPEGGAEFGFALPRYTEGLEGG
jgi:signal transduction histidine kinase